MTLSQANLIAMDREESTSDLLYRLGKAIEDRPGVIITHDHTYNSNERPLAGLSLDRRVNFNCIDRLEAFAAERRAELGEERWRQLNREWNGDDE